jgi:putative colanic acid biosynthesis acetyltransferase WcaF
MSVDLSSFNNNWYKPGNPLMRFLWYFFNVFFFLNPLNPSSKFKVVVLKLFGAKIGSNVVIKPRVNIKYPWFLSIGENSWIGEAVWIDNLGQTRIGANVCISQGALLLSGNHDYKKTTFDLLVGEISINDGAWIGAKAMVTGGVTCHELSILTAGSVTSKDLNKAGIYKGNPAVLVRKRTFLKN